jgi:phosphoglycolate phosphatase-like HAD superfamily hydrolase
MKKIRAVIFDFDDTLVNTTAFFFEHLQKTLTKLYGKEYDQKLIEKAKTLWKKNLDFEDIFKQTFSDDWEKVLSTYREDAMETKYTPKDGMVEYVAKLRADGIRLFILSNRTNMLEERLEQAGFNPKDFNIYQAVEKKPSQLAYSEVLAKLEKGKILIEKVLIYGNHEDDFEALPNKWKDQFIYVEN